MPPYVDDACSELTIDAEWDKMCVCYVKSETNEEVCFTIIQDEEPPMSPPPIPTEDILPSLPETTELTDSTISANTTTEVCKVFEEWTSDEESSVNLDIMEVDEKIGADFLCDDLFDGGVAICPQDEFVSTSTTTTASSTTGSIDDDTTKDDDEEDDDDDEEGIELCLHHNQRLEEAFHKLSASMQRSQESRVALSMKTKKTRENEKYSKEQNVSTVLAEIEKSRKQLRECFGHPTSP
mmetsp:Transcript_35901/g.39684  ORF Transcript_35901/g.39684 Transcript_35901/m.39684 type:complete len:238 (-) Transcript_35901:657-1370(-)|eukprot:CAMPEP_0194162704 /NCGR_PEP_ID=MMETSP0152-20130528/79637_1 /TAXON_ID=1049557 /ORGANISM="Thalassiothrix antarctica, Strain L6-D1" /LENGTH=237 /DNA_ID=CAMNT_0038872621 /DNA_START=227 /DNA_END=940 /DNA_ORIENTATION=-